MNQHGLHSQSAAYPQRDGLVERTVKNLPHVTPSPRVPAANPLHGPASRFLLGSIALLERDGLVKRTVKNLPHVTPSPRVPAANQLGRFAPLWTHTTVLFFQGRAPRKRTVKNLPHVTPSPRVPAANSQPGAAPLCYHSLPALPTRDGPVWHTRSESASRHSFPKSTCSQSAG
jgi:hypothetical protein